MQFTTNLVATAGHYKETQGLSVEGNWPQLYEEIAVGQGLAEALFGTKEEALDKTLQFPSFGPKENKRIVGIVELGEDMERPGLDYPLQSIYTTDEKRKETFWQNGVAPLIIIRNNDYDRIQELHNELKEKYSGVADIRVIELSYDLNRTLEMQHSVMLTSWFLSGMLIVQTCFVLFAFTIVKTREIAKYTGIQRTVGATAHQIIQQLMKRTGLPFVIAGFLAFLLSLAQQIAIDQGIWSTGKALILILGPFLLCIASAILASWIPAKVFSEKEPADLL